MRSLLSILLIGVPVTLILCLVGLSHGMLEDSQRRARGIGADIIVRASERIVASSASAAPPSPRSWSTTSRSSPREDGHRRDQPSGRDCRSCATGIDLDEVQRMSGGFTYLEGGPFDGPDDVLIDQLLRRPEARACRQHHQTDQHDWRVAGIIEGGKLARIVVPLERAAGPRQPPPASSARSTSSWTIPPTGRRRRGESQERSSRTIRSTPWRSSRRCST